MVGPRLHTFLIISVNRAIKWEKPLGLAQINVNIQVTKPHVAEQTTFKGGKFLGFFC